jgi:hypothetical protein
MADSERGGFLLLRLLSAGLARDWETKELLDGDSLLRSERNGRDREE